MVDENVFLTFDAKLNGLNNEKDKIRQDIETYKLFTDNLKLIENIVEKTYTEIYEFLVKYLEITKFSDIKSKINMDNISEINKKEILERILGDIKKKESNPKFIEFLRNVRRLKNDSTLGNKNPSEDIEMRDTLKSSKKEKTILILDLIVLAICVIRVAPNFRFFTGAIEGFLAYKRINF